MLAFTRATCWGAAHKLALSFRKMPDCDKQHLSVVPPLLREEVLDISRHRDDFITGYIINAGFSEMVKQWHQAHPHVKLHFFWDKADADEVTKIDDTLTSVSYTHLDVYKRQVGHDWHSAMTSSVVCHKATRQ